MPWWVSIYVAFMVISLPFGALVLRRMQQDYLHPVGGLVSALLSIGFVISYWMPELVPFSGTGTLLLFAYIIGWDLYSLRLLKDKLPEMFDLPEQERPEMDANSVLFSLVLMLPAYIFAALVCMRAIGTG
ncbi:MAG: hypothetical protein CSA49_04640 [Gammaproteobacteria bacterium]|nr:MAG: hypothetical protein CSA49_04640 [Gammaproteobacteria bacterium]